MNKFSKATGFKSQVKYWPIGDASRSLTMYYFFLLFFCGGSFEFGKEIVKSGDNILAGYVPAFPFCGKSQRH